VGQAAPRCPGGGNRENIAVLSGNNVLRGRINMKTRAAVAWEAGKPLEIATIDLDGPEAGEVLLRNVATGVCHTDAFTLSGEDPEGIFPAVLATRAARLSRKSAQA